jgi:hypothetical protein
MTARFDPLGHVLEPASGKRASARVVVAETSAATAVVTIAVAISARTKSLPRFTR